MRQIKIVADSSADILSLEGIDFCSAPLKIITAEREFVDDENLDVNGMADFLYNYKGQSKSSCPNVNDWLEAFGEAEDIFCLTITGGLSGSYNSACMAKDLYEAEHPGRRVFVLDTLSAGPEIKLAIEYIRRGVLDGVDYEEICTGVQEYIRHTGLIFMLKSLKNFANNGRVSPAVAKIAGIMGICIVGKASDEGTLEPTHKCRGEARSLETLISDMEAYGLKTGRVRIAHCQNEEGAMKLRDMVLERFGSVDVEVYTFRGLCSFYAEKGGILVGFEKY